jgi:hypothetical protein
MFDQHFLSSAAPADVFGPLHGGERVMWRGRCGVAEYAFDEAASLPRWTLPETTDVLVTDQRVLYSYTAEDGHQVRSGELRWLWPQHLRVQPGRVSRDRGVAATQIQLVCGGADGTYPAVVFAGGDLASVSDADRLANVMRQAIARFRVDNADKLGLSIGQARMLSRLLIGPEFRNHQGGPGQTVSLLGAMLVSRPAPAPALPRAGSIDELLMPADETVTVERPRPVVEETMDFVRAAAFSATAEVAWPLTEELVPRTRPRTDQGERTAELPADPMAEGTRLITYRPGMAADAARALMAAKAEEATQRAAPALASRAADLAARVADLVSRAAGPEPTQDEVSTWDFNPYAWRSRTVRQRSSRSAPPRHSEPRVSDVWRSDGPGDGAGFDLPTTNLVARAESIRRTAARMAANSTRGRIGVHRDPGVSTRGNGTT